MKKPSSESRVQGLPGACSEIQGVQVIDAHAVKQGCGKDIHPFGDFVMVVAHDLRSSKATTPLVPCRECKRISSTPG